MLIKTLRFGEMDIEQTQIIDFPWGLPGFPEQKRFVSVHYGDKEPFSFLQSLDMPELTFILGDPFQLTGNYVFDIPQEDLEALDIQAPEEALVSVIITLRQEGKEVTANLAAPLVINTRNNKARQVILTNTPYNARFILVSKAG